MEVINFLNKTQITTKAYVAIKYFGESSNALNYVVFLTEKKKNLEKITKIVGNTEKMSKKDRKTHFQNTLTDVCHNLLDKNIEKEIIQNYIK